MAFLITDGSTVAPLDETYQLLGGGLRGSLGEGPSTGLGTLFAVAIVGGRWRRRHRSRAHGIEVPSLTAELLGSSLAVLGVAGFVELSLIERRIPERAPADSSRFW